MPHLAQKLQRSLLPSGSSRSIGRRPHLGNTTPLARNSTQGEHRNDHDSNSNRRPGDRSLMPLTLQGWLPLMQLSSARAPRKVLLRYVGLVDPARFPMVGTHRLGEVCNPRHMQKELFPRRELLNRHLWMTASHSVLNLLVLAGIVPVWSSGFLVVVLIGNCKGEISNSVPR